MNNLTVYQVAELIGCSHTAIYNKLNNKQIYKEIKPFIIRDGRQRLVKQEGIEILKRHINLRIKLTESLENETNTSKETPQDTRNYFLEGLIKDLQEQLKTKDRQIQALEEAFRNNQILFLNSQKILQSREQKEKRTFLQWIGLKNE